MKLKSGQKVTIYDIAELAGVAPGTVSRALNNIGYVKQETRERVEDAAKKLNYLPNRVARSLKTRKTELLLLAIPDMDNPCWVRLISAVQEVVQKHGYSMILYYTGGTVEGELRAIQMLQQQIADGMVLVNLCYNNRYREEIAQCQYPLVLCQMADGLQEDYARYRFDDICIDTGSAIEKMVDHLIEQGHERIAYVGGTCTMQSFTARYEGYCRAMAAHGLHVSEKDFVLTEKWLENDGFMAAQLLWTHGQRPTAICCSHDVMALGVMDFLKRQNIAVGKELALVGIDNIDLCSKLTPSLSSACIHQWDIGIYGTQLVFDRIFGKTSQPYEKKVFQGDLLIRESSTTYQW